MQRPALGDMSSKVSSASISLYSHLRGRENEYLRSSYILTSEEIHEHVSEGLEVVPPGLLLAEVRVDAHVAGGPRQALVLPVGNVLVRVCGGDQGYMGERRIL